MRRGGRTSHMSTTVGTGTRGPRPGIRAPRRQAPPRDDPRRQGPPRDDPRRQGPPRDDPRRQDPRRQDPRRQDPRRADPDADPRGHAGPTAPRRPVRAPGGPAGRGRPRGSPGDPGGPGSRACLGHLAAARVAHAVHPGGARAAGVRPRLPAGDQYDAGRGILPDQQPAAGQYPGRSASAGTAAAGVDRRVGELDTAASAPAGHAGAADPQLCRPADRPQVRHAGSCDRCVRRPRIHPVTPGDGSGASGSGDRDEWPGRRPARRAWPSGGPARPAVRRAGPGRRLNVSLLCLGFALTLLAGRLVQLQGLHWASYRALAQQQMLPPGPILIPVVRGSISSRDGTVLAMTVQTDLVYADPKLIPQAQRPQVAAALAGPLGLGASAIQVLIDHPTSPEYVVLKRDVSAATGARITALKLPGIAETSSYSRAYPNGDLAANLIGFANADTAGDLSGKAGLEAEYNSLLAGRDGSEEVELGPPHKPIPQTEQIVRPPVPAGSLRLTIQADIQWYAEQACAAQVKAARARNCSVVVMQPGTGRMLALAQYPTFSPADPQTVAATADIPVQNVFQPGSTAKVITAAAALEHGGQTPMSTYTVPDQVAVDGFAFHDGETHATARYTIAGIVANALNDGMVQVVRHVSPQVQYQYFKAFGLGEPTGLNLPGESAGILPPPARWWGDTRYTLSFGQGVAVNAVQMASVYATIANGGGRGETSILATTTHGSRT